MEDKITIPRRCAASEIKLLRLDLFSHSKSVSEDIGCQWNHAQPAENLSPAKAAVFLNVEVWTQRSLIEKRYKSLQLRYPPEQFRDKHLDWRPSFELLSSPRLRLNWFWQSGFVPHAETNQTSEQNPLWNRDSVEPIMTPQEALRRLSHP